MRLNKIPLREDFISRTRTPSLSQACYCAKKKPRACIETPCEKDKQPTHLFVQATHETHQKENTTES
ncbi:hypothetical protein FJTKL_09043 [Diaporthe vaccinii]|uniref:Uncharacterized protein n=1 Tax=Diaporthe vaccinii TaxID=105482 RepID=A0ABR4EPH4_9PEZI